MSHNRAATHDHAELDAGGRMFGAGNHTRGRLVGHGPRGGRQTLRAAAATAVVAAVLTGTAACGGEAQDSAKPDATPRSTAGAGTGALTQQQLTALAFTDGEQVGPYTASEFSLGEPYGEDFTADPADCQPLVSLASDVTSFHPVAEVHREVDDPDEMIGPSVAVQLRSYADDGAARVMKALDTAGRQCARGFTEVRAIARAKYLKAEPAKAPAIGDEAKAYRFTILDVKGKLKLYEYLTVVRSGTTTLSFRAGITDTKDIGGVPQEVIKAQWVKFAAGKPAGGA
ncbi:hypothetical protein [Streptomyces sp. NBC_00259]|uniref:hypothetical protein n=1 Tax=Streptomyces sp. NBC_00259 TaxID=2903643 RepID=UPI002E2D596A|nr:hypothetical protein [Streptomyces sp. NBC_00259]